VIEYLLRKSVDAHTDLSQPPGWFFIQGALPYSDKPPAPKQRSALLSKAGGSACAHRVSRSITTPTRIAAETLPCFSYYDSANDLSALLSLLDIDSAILVGMSQGGFLGMRCALTHPERVRALVLISTQALAKARAMKEAIPNAELVVITGSHSLNITNPGSENAALNDLFERHHLVS
jgi:pimeloyl-ACP methyl ester carboxylesterase